MRLRLIIDDQDRDTRPDAPLTVTAYRDDDDGTASRLPLTFTDGEDMLTGTHVPALLAQAARLWPTDETELVTGRPDDPAAEPAGEPNDPAEQTWTFTGHWESGRIVVEYVLPGAVQDPREDTGYWDEGLFAAAGTGTTQEEALAAVRAEYETRDEDDCDPADHDPTYGCVGHPDQDRR